MGNTLIADQVERQESLKGQLAYVEDALTHDLEAWERKEYTGLKEQYESQIDEIEAHIEFLFYVD